MNHGLCTSRLCFIHNYSEGLCTIMTIGYDADFHGVVVFWEYPVLAIMTNFLSFPLSTFGSFIVYNYNGGATM